MGRLVIFMSVKIEEQKNREGKKYAAVSGRVDIQHVSEFETALQKLAEQAQKAMVIDLSRVDYLCSSALGVLISINRSLIKQQKELRLVAVSGVILEVLHITMLDTVFSIYSSLKEAFS